MRIETPALRLARYLKEFVGLRSTTVRDVAKYESVIWFGDMPQEADCRSGAWTHEHTSEEPWLEVKKQEFRKPPEPSVALAPWIDAKALGRATAVPPPLRTSIWVEDTEATLDEGADPPIIEKHLADHPAVMASYDSFRPKWEAWAAEQRRRESVQKIYAELFRLHTQLQKQGELLELVIGLGFVDWRANLEGQTVPIRRHAVVAQVELDFDPAKGVIQVAAPGEGARLQIEDDMLEAELRPDRSHYAVALKQLEEVDDAIWDRALVHAALRTWAGALSADSTWSEDLNPKPPSDRNPSVSFAPALILRKRQQTGMVRIYQKLIENLEPEDATVPVGWGRLIDDDWQDETAVSTSSTINPDTGSRASPRSTETFFPLPANREQRRIVHALQHNQGVLVQGPPGTGKSHTIANLICHLLATGKRVLITAETARALQVLKEKLPEEVQPLCVSLLGQGGDAFAELNSAVQGITNRQSSYSPDDNERQISELDRELDQARRQLAEIDYEIRSLRQDETIEHGLIDGAYVGTASMIAARITSEREQFGWLRLTGTSASRLGITNHQATRWLAIRRLYSAGEIEEARHDIPNRSTLPLPDEFGRLISIETEASSGSAHADASRSHPAYLSVSALSPEDRATLKTDLIALEAQRLALQRCRLEWLPKALQDTTTGRTAEWTTLLEISGKGLDKVRTLLPLIDTHAVVIPDGMDLRKLRIDAMSAARYLKSGGKWKHFGLITPDALKGREYLKRDVLVDGQPADKAGKLGVVSDHADLELALSDLQKAWGDVGVTNFSADRRLRLANLDEHASALSHAIKFTKSCEQSAHSLSSRGTPIPTPDWLSGEAQQWIDLIAAADLDDELRKAKYEIEKSVQTLTALGQLHNAHPVAGALIAVVAARDVRAYSETWAHIGTIEKMREEDAERTAIERALNDAIPGLVRTIESSLGDTAWDTRLAALEEAWRWSSVDTWLEKRTDLDHHRKLWKRRHATEESIGRLVAGVASLRAWKHFFDRLSPPETNALRSWREAVRQMGKGTGKSAKLARLRQDARRYMDACRDAIPIWIMPRYLVAEMIDPSPGRYDLVIVDEASQLGIESLFLFYIAKKMIVVGDDQQISPAGVGISDDAVTGLQQHYLEGVPHRHALSPQSSLYGNAKIRFNQNIVLREHFRCMPEIIQFSNELCYESNGTPLDPLRAYPANRLEPLVLRHVSDGYRQGSSTHAQNLPEAEAIVAQICGCIDDPRYAGATIGVISLQGDAQAKLIERQLLEALDPEIIEERRIICGDAYAFQGDERNIIFLSMVAAPGEARIGVLSNEAAKQRFNVAVSRAQDQLWLFHSAELDVLSQACMRHRLLSYMLNPQRRKTDEGQQRFDSEFERQVYRLITGRNFHVRTQVCVGDPTNHRYRIDLVVEGMQGRLAVECDGDAWHGPDRYEHDMARQRDLERAGWQFVRVRGGDFYRDQAAAMEPVWAELQRLGIQPGGVDTSVAHPPQPRAVEHPRETSASSDNTSVGEPASTQSPVTAPSAAPADAGGGLEPESSSDQAPFQVALNLPPTPEDDAEPESEPADETDTSDSSGAKPSTSALPSGAARYRAFTGNAGPDPRESKIGTVADGLCRIIETEGPMLAKRAYDLYLRGCGVQRMGGELKKSMNKSLEWTIRSGRVVKEDESGTGGLLYSVVRPKGAPAIVLRERGPREFDEIPPSELKFVAHRLARVQGLKLGSAEHLRAVLEYFELRRLTKQVETRLLDILARTYSNVEEDIVKREEGCKSDGIRGMGG